MVNKGNQPRTRIERWSDSPLLTLVSRVAVIAGTPAMLSVLGWLMVAADRNNTEIAALNATVAGNLAMQREASGYFQREVDGFKLAVKDTFSDHENRIRSLEKDNDGRKPH